MIDLLILLGLGYTVTFEGSEVGDFFCLLRRLGTSELVHCSVGNTPEGALRASVKWAEAGMPGNGTATRQPTFTLAERVAALEVWAEGNTPRLAAIEARVEQCETGRIDAGRVYLTVDATAAAEQTENELIAAMADRLDAHEVTLANG